jgi:hypothetical protein
VGIAGDFHRLEDTIPAGFRGVCISLILTLNRQIQIQVFHRRGVEDGSHIPETEADPFGGMNSIIEVGEGEGCSN